VTHEQVAAIGLVLHPTRPVGDSIATISAWVRGRSARLLARESDARRLPAGVDVVADAQFAGRVDALVALGGDGTMLGAMRLVVGRRVPVLGVNHGSLGFLVEVTPDTLGPALDRLSAGDFTIESHACLVAEARGVDLATGFGFNDVVLARLGRIGAVSVDLTVNDQRYGYYKGDAVVIATAHGSTAYNYAAGGPVLSPSAAATVITPVAPMAGIGRAVVLGQDDRIVLDIAPESAPVAIDVDGTAAGELKPGGSLTARLQADAGHVVRFSAGEHASRSRIRLSLLDLPLRRDQLLELIPEHVRREAFSDPRSPAADPAG
jgi:NAD+ kinase